MKMNKCIGISSFFCIFLFVFSSCNTNYGITEKATVTNNTIWKDVSGNALQTHDNIIKVNGKYYWYGMDYSHNLKTGDYDGFKSVKCYESQDLVNWKLKNNVLTAQSSDLLYKADVYSPYVVYNPKTQVYVMWLGYGSNKSENSVLVAVSNSPYGNFHIVNSCFKPEGNDAIVTSLFKDTDGACYAIFYSGKSMAHICRLTDDYLSIDSENSLELNVKRQFGRSAVVRGEYGNYYLLMADYGINDADNNGVDDCVNAYYSFWKAGSAGYSGLSYAFCDSMLGQWSGVTLVKDGDNNPVKEYEFSGVVQIEGQTESSQLLMFNAWKASDLSNSAYVWLPFEIDEYHRTVKVNRCEKVTIDAFAGTFETK